VETLSLSRLNEYLRRVITINFSEPLWINAELVQCNLNKGNYYIELAEREESTSEILAQSVAVIWKTTWNNLKARISPEILREGNKLRLKVHVEYHIRYGLKLNIIDIDESYTIGVIVRQRQEIISRLITEKLWQRNKESKIPVVVKRVAVITSLTAAGKRDFETHLLENEYSYTFSITYFKATMQGNKTASEIVRALSLICQRQDEFDCVAIIRGGGAKMDLIDFDSYDIAKKLAFTDLPVLTGIGHDQDESVTDLSAYRQLKTPTAVADYFIQHNLFFESQMTELYQKALHLCNARIHRNMVLLANTRKNMVMSSTAWQQNKMTRLKNLTHRIQMSAQNWIQSKNLQLLNTSHLLESYNPLLILEKGYSMNFQNNRRIKSIEDIDFQKDLTTVLRDGMVISKIEKTSKSS